MSFQNSYLEGDNEPIRQHDSFGFLLLSSMSVYGVVLSVGFF